MMMEDDGFAAFVILFWFLFEICMRTGVCGKVVFGGTMYAYLQAPHHRSDGILEFLIHVVVF